MTDDISELVRRLRGWSELGCAPPVEILSQAADALERLQTENTDIRAVAFIRLKYWMRQTARAEAAEMRLAMIMSDSQGN